MADVDPGLMARPDHVPPELVADFDLFDIPGGEDDVQLAMRAFQQKGPDIFWTPRNGGHWVVTRAEDIARVRYEGGLVTYSDVLLAQARRLRLEEQVVETKGALARDTAALFKALGGGWPELAQAEAQP